MNKINVAYFSCARDKAMLEISIASSRWEFNQIYVFSDPNDPIEEFKGVNLIQRKTGSKKLYGLDNIRDMHDCLKIASDGADYVLKKDSDIFDCSDYAYKILEENKFDCYGGYPMARANMLVPGHFNGNAYFIKSSIIHSFPDEFPEAVHGWKFLNYPEDMVTSAICNTITKNIKIDGTAQHFDGRYLFDIFLNKVAELPAEEIREYGFAHCRSNERMMKFFKDKL